MLNLRIKSAQDAFALELGPVKRSQKTFLAELQGGPCSGAVEVYDDRHETLADFFEDIANNWRGWEGEKTWYSLENHLLLDASADALGHVLLRVTLQDLSLDWQVRANILMEAGQLKTYAEKARAVFASR